MTKLNSQQTILKAEIPFLKTNIPVLNIGDSIKIGVKIIEGSKERVQFYEGTILAKKNSGINKTITVRKIFQGIRSSKIRRSKLYYLRNLKGKASRLKQKFK